MQHEKLHAPWYKFTNSYEEQKLITLNGRIDRQKTLWDWGVRERTLIMNRAIRWIRRAEGKQ